MNLSDFAVTLYLLASTSYHKHTIHTVPCTNRNYLHVIRERERKSLKWLWLFNSTRNNNSSSPPCCSGHGEFYMYIELVLHKMLEGGSIRICSLPSSNKGTQTLPTTST